MDTIRLESLQKLNQLKLTEEETEKLLVFFTKAQEDASILEAIDTDNIERMVHVMPLTNIIRQDVAKKIYTREQLQKQAPEEMDGYWQVPRLVD